MRDDADGVTAALKGDSLIKEFGLRQYEKLGHHQQNHQYISQKMKELGRLLLQIKEVNPAINSLEKCLYPCNWEDLMKAVKKVAGFDDKTHKYSIPSLPLKLGYSLKKCAAIMKNKAIKEGDEQKKGKAQSFLDLYNDEWSDRISAHALDTLHEAHYNKPHLLPLVDDVVRLHQYLERRGKELALQIKAKTDLKNTYFELAKICLSQIILFNRKRSGEAQRLKTDDLQKGLILENAGLDKEVKESLTKFEIVLCETHKRIETRGKRGRKVSVILTKKMEQNIQVLIDNRHEVGVNSEFLFGKTNSTFTLRGSDALREMAVKSGAKQPSRITSTNLRMQLATLCQVLGLSSNSQDILAKFLGHDIRIHREFYRLPDNTLELAKVTKVLHAFNTGNIAQFKGKDFDEIEFDASETIEPEIQNEIDDDASDDSLDDFQEDQDGSPQIPSKKCRTDSDKTSRERTSWTREEQEAAKRQLNHCILSRKLPGKIQCLHAKDKEPALANRSWLQIKHFIRNKIVKVSKCLNQGACSNRQNRKQ